jgi:hypothetical protein
MNRKAERAVRGEGPAISEWANPWVNDDAVVAAGKGLPALPFFVVGRATPCAPVVGEGRQFSRQIITLAATRKVSVALFSHEQVRRVFFADGQGTIHARAEILAKRFSEELGSRLPPKRRAWMSEDSRMDIFDAVALALMLRLKRAKRTAPCVKP